MTKLYDTDAVEEYTSLTTAQFLTEEQKELNAPQKKKKKFRVLHLHIITMYLKEEIVW